MSESTEWARSLVAALAKAGIQDVVISPGSRSTPLVFAAAGQGALRLHSVIDERAAAFFAVGQARVTGLPTALICTSGTAGAHYYPAVIEASLAYVPLVVITADRPPELQASAAAQTIDQQRLFGTYVRAYHDLGLPNAAPIAFAAVRRKVVQAVFRATNPTPGPVHVNVPARKPLEPAPSETASKPVPPSSIPMVIRSRPKVDPDDLDEIGQRLVDAERPVFVVGPGGLPQADLREVLADLARKADAAVYAEATSQLRFGNAQPGDALGVLLGAETFAAQFQPDLVLQLGAPVTSSAWHRWRGGRSKASHIAISSHDWPDPSQRADTWVAASPAEVIPLLRDAWTEPRGHERWRAQMADYDRRAWAVVDDTLPAQSEGEAVRVIRAHLPPDSLLMLGNSLAVRHFDTFCRSGGEAVGVLSQRGANGIDGLVAGAVGATSVARRPVTLVLGDVSLAHDVGALALAQSVSRPLVIVVLDNGGGRIFELLPAGRRYGQQPVFRHFVTPPKMDAETLAAAFGLCHVRLEGTAELAAALTSAYRMGAATVVQVKLPDHGARAVADAIDAALNGN